MTAPHRDFDTSLEVKALQASVRTTSSLEFQGHVDSAQHREVTITFPRDGGPIFAIGQELTVSFRSREVFEPFAASARVIFRKDDPYQSRYRFEVGESDAQTLSALYKRRGGARMRPEEDFPVETLATGIGDDSRVRCKLRDISKSGLSLCVSQADEAKLCSLDRMSISFELPGDGSRIEVEAEVRYRQLEGEEVHYGLEFDRISAAVVESIEAFILRRQDEIVEGALGPTWLAKFG